MAGRRVRRRKNLPPQPAEPTEPGQPVEAVEAVEPGEAAEPTARAGPAGANGTDRSGGAAAWSEWWARARAGAAQAVEEAQALWARGTAPRAEFGAAPAAPSDATRLVPALRRVRDALAAPL